MSENFKETCTQCLKSLVEKCDEDAYMKSRLIIHLKDILPNALENEYKTHKESEKRKVVLEKELLSFQTFFLANNRYYYLASNCTFYLYHENTCKQVKEDDIIYKLLSTVTYDNKSLIDWKYKTKVSLIKKIKERNLFRHLIPETKTIQSVLNCLSPMYFLTKNEAKYFLTCIGDNLLKKQSDQTYYVPSNSKQNLTELDTMCSVITGINNITSSFVSKYNENVSLVNCRLIRMKNTNITSHEKWIQLLRSDGLNILCTAAYYSNANGCGDNFLEKREELCEYALFLKNNTRENIFELFCKNYLETTDEEVVAATPQLLKGKTLMTWKNMQYIWKIFLSDYSIPGVIYSHQLKIMLTGKYTYDMGIDSFLNVTSRRIPIVSDFMYFWSETMKKCSTTSFVNDYEMDEVSTMFVKFVKDNPANCVTAGRIVEEDIISILTHYYPEIEISENKYILNVDCDMWRKQSELELFLEDARVFFAEQRKMQEDKTVDFDELYKHYLKSKKEYTMSKNYFDRFLIFFLKKYIDHSCVLSEKWLVTDAISEEITSLLEDAAVKA